MHSLKQSDDILGTAVPVNAKMHKDVTEVMALNKRQAKRMVAALTELLRENNNEPFGVELVDYRKSWIERTFGSVESWLICRSEGFRLKLFLEDQLSKGYPDNLIFTRERIRRLPFVLKPVDNKL